MRLVMMAAAVAATTPAPLAPSGKWVVDYRPDTCLVSRSFGPANDNTMFAIEPAIAMSEGGETLFVLGPKSGGSGVRRGHATVTLLPSGTQKKTDYVSWVPTGGESRAYEFQADTDLATPIAEATSIVLATSKESFSFATGKMRPVLNALRTCNEYLFRTWGIDPSANVVAEVRGNPGAWFSADSYPAEAMRRGAEGRNVVILTVSEDGRPTACHVTVRVDPALDQATCQLVMARGRYRPAPGKIGRYAVLAVRWVLPI